MALRQVTRQINKMKPLLADLNNYEFVSVEMKLKLEMCQLTWVYC